MTEPSNLLGGIIMPNMKFPSLVMSTERRTYISSEIESILTHEASKDAT